MKIFLLGLLLILSCTAIETLTQNELESAFTQGKHIWVVYRTNNHQNQDAVNRAAETLKGFFRSAIVNSDQESLQLYGDDRSQPIIYSGQFTPQSIITFVLNQLDKIIENRAKVAKDLKAFQQFQEKQKERAKKEWEEEQQLRKKSNTVLLDNVGWETNFLKSREPFLINFFESNCSACIELNREWQKISLQLKGRVKVAKINITQDQNHKIEQELRITKYPTIRFYKDGPKKINQFSEYEGTRKQFSITSWVNQKLSEKVEKTEIASLNKQNYQTLCKGSKNTCIVVFLDGQQPADTLSKIEKLALEHLKKPVTFLISNKGQQEAFAQQVGVSSYPDTVLVYCKMKKLWRMDSLIIEEIDNAINEISLGNRNNFVRYNFAEELK